MKLRLSLRKRDFETGVLRDNYLACYTEKSYSKKFDWLEIRHEISHFMVNPANIKFISKFTSFRNIVKNSRR